MKKIIFFIILCFILCMNIETTLAQNNNLQFNRVILVNSLQTVPTGKVWKVESVLSTSDLVIRCTNYCSVNFSILINGVNIIMASSDYSYNSNSNDSRNITALPIWLPEGTTLNKGTNTAFISVIEYNLVP
jgi:hypothetical protein